jgi:hypothetical protein
MTTAAAAVTAKAIFTIWEFLLGLDTDSQLAGTWEGSIFDSELFV